MARIRSIKPEFWSDRKLARLTSRDARTLYIALWNLADEHCRLNGDPQWLKGQVFPYDDDIDAPYISKLLAELENPALGAVMAYEADGDPYLFLPKLSKHQRLEPEKVTSRLPAPPDPGAADVLPDDPEPPPARPAPPARQPEPHTNSSEPRADKFAPRADQSKPRANSSALLYVAGGREHGAGILPSVGVVNHPTDRNARTRDDDDPIITTIIETIYDQTDRVIDAYWAAKIRDHIASLAKTAKPGPAYFKAAIEREPDAAKRFLEHDPPPAWCGRCSPARRIEDPETGADLRPCPDCHPVSLRKEPA